MRRLHLYKEDRLPLCDKAFFAGTVFMLSALILLVLTFFHLMKLKTDMDRILIVNLTSVAALLLLGLFLRKWAQVYSLQNPPYKIMKCYRILTILVSIVCVLKSAVSVFFSILYLPQKDLPGIYYAGEALAWIALTVFFISYSKKIVSDDEFIRDEFVTNDTDGYDDEEDYYDDDNDNDKDAGNAVKNDVVELKELDNLQL
ncbi:MAG: hypothetical protein MJY89_07875 [Bacteroidales bacterium]|nr:hypothetical protein [Bacteroidales bacterium]